MAKTVQSMIDEGMQLWASCQTRGPAGPCHHMRQIDLAALRDRLGPDASTMAPDLAPKLRCSKCGGKDIGLTVIPRSRASGDPRGVLDGTAWQSRKI
jgi:hypothetical protein